MDNVLRLPFSTPPNALVISARKYTFMDYVKVGLLLQIMMGIVMVFILLYYLYYSHSKHSHTHFSFIFAVCKTVQENLWIYRLNRLG